MSVEDVAGVALLGLLLSWVRWFGVLLVAPLLAIATGGRHWPVAAALAAVLAAADASTLAGGGSVVALAADGPALALALASELALGLVIGTFVSWGAHAIVGASATSAWVLRVPRGPWALLVAALVLGAALGLGLHHAAWRASAGLRDAFPIGQPAAWWDPSVGDGVATWLAGMMALALALATPAVLVAAVCDLAWAAIARGPAAAAALASASSSSLRLAAVLVALAASWSIDLPRWAAHGVAFTPPVAPDAFARDP